MGKKPLVGLAGLCLAGLIVCGCQDNKRYSGGPRGGVGSGGGVRVPGPTPAPGASPTASSGWDTTPAKNLASRPGGSGDLGGSAAGAGLGSSTPLAGSGSGLGSSTALGGSGSGLGSSGPGSGMRSPTAGLPGTGGAGMTDPGSMGGSGLGSQPAPMGMPAGMPSGSRGLGQTSNLSGGMGGSRIADPPPSTPTGMGSSGGLGGTGTGSSNGLLTPPAPPAGMRTGQGTYNLSDPGAGASAPSMNQSNMTGGYRTVPGQPGLGASPLPAPPPVPTVNNSSFQQ